MKTFFADERLRSVMACSKLDEFGGSPNVESRVIPSQAYQEWFEGVETRESIPERKKSPRASGISIFRDDDIVRTYMKVYELKDKEPLNNFRHSKRR